jgi:hypothetical protein
MFLTFIGTYYVLFAIRRRTPLTPLSPLWLQPPYAPREKTNTKFQKKGHLFWILLSSGEALRRMHYEEEQG